MEQSLLQGAACRKGGSKTANLSGGLVQISQLHACDVCAGKAFAAEDCGMYVANAYVRTAFVLHVVWDGQHHRQQVSRLVGGAASVLPMWTPSITAMRVVKS